LFSPVSFCLCYEIDSCGFEEKPLFNKRWIDGGFMIVNPSFIKLIVGGQTVLEHSSFEVVIG
jgi:hypothetical protein